MDGPCTASAGARSVAQQPCPQLALERGDLRGPSTPKPFSDSTITMTPFQTAGRLPQPRVSPALREQRPPPCVPQPGRAAQDSPEPAAPRRSEARPPRLSAAPFRALSAPAPFCACAAAAAMALETVPKDLRHLRACLLCSLVKVRSAGPAAFSPPLKGRPVRAFPPPRPARARPAPLGPSSAAAAPLGASRVAAGRGRCARCSQWFRGSPRRPSSSSSTTAATTAMPTCR